SGTITIIARDLIAPSPLAAEVLGSKPYTFLDDAPLEERRTQAVQNRRWADPQNTDDLGRLDPEAIAAVRTEAWPEARNPDEMHEALMGLGIITDSDVRANAGWQDMLAALANDQRASRMCIGEVGFWFAAERLPQLRALHPDAAIAPRIEAPQEFAEVAWTSEDALVDLVRARLTGLGPTDASLLAASFVLSQSTIDAALLRLESEGYVMRGSFDAGIAIQWCERHLLARIHRYTIGKLRREIEPVAVRDYMRFAFEWQRVAPNARMSGPDSLAKVLAQLEGFEAAASAWEKDLLQARIKDYDAAWLDAQCQSGRVVWSRLRGRKSISMREPVAQATRAGPVRATPIVLLPRRALPIWSALANTKSDVDGAPSSRARIVADYLATHGASFFDEIVTGTHLLQTEIEDALGELVAQGLVNSDSFAGLRTLIKPASKRPRSGAPRRTHRGAIGIADAGRWSMLRRDDQREAERDKPADLEHVARTLLLRYGVVCWRILEREALWLPPWRELLRVFHRLEARGEIRGGRFIAGLTGEQFALPEAIGLLRQVRQRAHDGTLTCISGADPLNLVGTIVPGTRVSSITSSRILYRDGLPIATLVANVVALLEPMSPADTERTRHALLRPGLPEPTRAELASLRNSIAAGMR
ncbi:MAG: ATP-dependent DNA helicase, partial [Lysobacteraceae bacterium]